VPYKLAVEEIMASQVNHQVLWSCDLGRRQVLGLSHPSIYAQQHHQAAGVVEIITNETIRALDLLVKLKHKDEQCHLS
jgi:hypothetical protein